MTATGGELDPTPLPRLPPRMPEAHKGDFGRVLVIGGARGMAGAVAMAGEAALRSGAGRVTIACPRSIYPILAAKVTCPTTLPVPETADETLAEAALEPLLAAAREHTAVAIGPGIGRSEETQRLVRSLLERLDRPWVADADALFAIAADMTCIGSNANVGVLTPHEGEMARIAGFSAAYIRRSREFVAHGFGERFLHVLVLKGAATLVVQRQRFWRNATGNPGMATGGSGDVLTGVIAALLGQPSLAPYDAARLGVHVHGKAGDLARDEVGEVGMIATDILAKLPAAWRAL